MTRVPGVRILIWAPFGKPEYGGGCRSLICRSKTSHAARRNGARFTMRVRAPSARSDEIESVRAASSVEGWGWGSFNVAMLRPIEPPPSPALPHKGGGSRPSAWRRCASISSESALALHLLSAPCPASTARKPMRRSSPERRSDPISCATSVTTIRQNFSRAAPARRRGNRNHRLMRLPVLIPLDEVDDRGSHRPPLIIHDNTMPRSEDRRILTMG